MFSGRSKHEERTLLSPPFSNEILLPENSPPEEYGEWQWAAAFGRATGRFGAEDARVARGREIALSGGSQPVVE